MQIRVLGFSGFVDAICVVFLADCIVNKKPLGGLLILLPWSGDGGEGGDGDGGSLIGVLEGFLMVLEQLLVPANVPVSIVSNGVIFLIWLFHSCLAWCLLP